MSSSPNKLFVAISEAPMPIAAESPASPEPSRYRCMMDMNFSM